MAVKFQKIVRVFAVLLASMLVVSGCQQTTTVEKKQVTKTTKSQEKKKPDQQAVTKEKEDKEPQEEEEEEVEEIIEVEVEEPVQGSTSQKTSSTPSVPKEEGNKAPQKEPDAQVSNEQTCYFSISCATILNNMDRLESGKETLVPSNGILYAQREVTFQEGETVFDVLLRETKKHGIHMEYSFTPGLNSNYIEGIANLYEMDCGPTSGWMYSVNGVYPDYGCSAYILEDQDVIEWNYTCDLGRDL